MKRRLLIAAGAALALVAAFVGGRFSAPRHVETRTEWKEIRSVETQWAVRTEYVDRTKIRTRVVTVERVAPDGSRETSTTTDSGTDVAINSGTDLTGHSSETTSSNGATVTVSKSGRPGYRVGVAAGWDPGRLSLRPSVYGVDVSRRLVGTIWAGAWGRTDKTFGINVALEL
jgi:hypothetical protein